MQLKTVIALLAAGVVGANAIELTEFQNRFFNTMLQQNEYEETCSNGNTTGLTTCLFNKIGEDFDPTIPSCNNKEVQVNVMLDCLTTVCQSQCSDFGESIEELVEEVNEEFTCSLTTPCSVSSADAPAQAFSAMLALGVSSLLLLRN